MLQFHLQLLLLLTGRTKFMANLCQSFKIFCSIFRKSNETAETKKELTSECAGKEKGGKSYNENNKEQTR